MCTYVSYEKDIGNVSLERKNECLCNKRERVREILVREIKAMVQ